MPDYRAYLLSQSGRASDAAIIIKAETDEEAIDVAKQCVEGHNIELRDGGRIVLRINEENELK